MPANLAAEGSIAIGKKKWSAGRSPEIGNVQVEKIKKK
jgi:hypothetical protein